MKVRKLVNLALGFGLALGMTACGSSQKTVDKEQANRPAEGALIGVTMPTRSSERWIHDGENLKKQLEKLGYKVDLQYAEDDIPTQVNQVDNQITKGARLLIVASIDGTALTTQMQKAEDQDIPVVSYDRLILNSPNVDYYATFDNYRVGVQQATSLLIGLGLKKADGSEGGAEGPFNIEVFAGSPDDNNATYFYNGAMDTLKPYLDDGRLAVTSGETDFDTIATLRWEARRAQSRMEDLITRHYRDGAKVDGVLSPFDSLSIGILSALKSNGYGTDDQPYPIVTGQDAEVASMKSIIAGEQYSTIFKDTRDLAEITVKMADAILKDGEVPVNNTEDYDNGEKVVPSYLLEPVIVTKGNYSEVLIDSGYYTDADLR